MPRVERSPKFKVIILTDAQINEAAALLSDREDAYKRYAEARIKLESLYQNLAGPKADWELDEDDTVLVVTTKPPWRE
jgi:hypothetical protein